MSGTLLQGSGGCPPWKWFFNHRNQFGAIKTPKKDFVTRFFDVPTCLFRWTAANVSSPQNGTSRFPEISEIPDKWHPLIAMLQTAQLCNCRRRPSQMTADTVFQTAPNCLYSLHHSTHSALGWPYSRALHCRISMAFHTGTHTGTHTNIILYIVNKT